jgi:tetratricopeptide (TPR) repeat protein
MTDSPVDRTRRRTTQGWFLLAQTPGEAAAAPAPGHPPLVPPEGFRERFPMQACGEGFHARLDGFARSRKRFAVIALRVESASAPPPPAAVVSAAEILDAACRPCGGLWGLVESDLLAAALPEVGDHDGESLAATLDADLRRCCSHSLTAGIAAFPCRDFPPQAIFANARKALEHAGFFGPGSRMRFDAVSLNISGDRRYDVQDLEGALGEYLHALDLDPTNANVLNSLGVCYGLQKRHDEALKAFEAALQQAPGEVMPIYNAGVVHLLQGNRDAARHCLLQAAPLGPEIFEVQFQTGKLLLGLREAARALPFLERAARLNPSAGPAHRLAGDACVLLKRLRAAVHFYRRAIRLNPNDAAALSATGKCYELLGERLEIPLTFCRQSVELAPDNGLYRMRLARLHLKAQQLEEAMEHYLRAGELGYQTGRLVDQLRKRLERAPTPESTSQDEVLAPPPAAAKWRTH